MTSRRLVVLFGFLAGGCSQDTSPRAAIAPRDHYTAILPVPGSDRPVDVEIHVPQGYEMQQLRDSISFMRRQRDPHITLRSRVRSPAHHDSGQKLYVATRNCDGRGSIVRNEPRRDGWLEVCRFTSYTGDPLQGTRTAHTSTRVLREILWGGAGFQCEVWFDKSESPSTSRVEQAIAICDSFHVRSKPAVRPECPLRSFKPTERRTGLIWFDPRRGRPEVAVDAEVPVGYERSDQGHSLVFRRDSCPDVFVYPMAVLDVNDMPRTEQGCLARLDPVLIRREARDDGWVAVCEIRNRTDPMHWFVVRRIRWGKQDFQCEVDFSDWDWIQDRESATPSRDRIEEAIAVCDSVKLREPTEREKCNAWRPSEQDGTGGSWSDTCSGGVR